MKYRKWYVPLLFLFHYSILWSYKYTSLENCKLLCAELIWLCRLNSNACKSHYCVVFKAATWQVLNWTNTIFPVWIVLKPWFIFCYTLEDAPFNQGRANTIQNSRTRPSTSGTTPQTSDTTASISERNTNTQAEKPTNQLSKDTSTDVYILYAKIGTPGGYCNRTYYQHSNVGDWNPKPINGILFQRGNLIGIVFNINILTLNIVLTKLEMSIFATIDPAHKI